MMKNLDEKLQSALNKQQVSPKTSNHQQQTQATKMALPTSDAYSPLLIGQTF